MKTNTTNTIVTLQEFKKLSRTEKIEYFATQECAASDSISMDDEVQSMSLVYYATIGGIAVVHDGVVKHETESEALHAAEEFQKSMAAKL